MPIIKEGSIIRRFKCPFCGWVHTFSPKAKSRHKKRVTGFVCPNCHRKPTEDDLNKKRGRGPKPKEKRRNRSKKEKVIEKNPIIVASQPYVKQLEWRTSGQSPPGETRRYGGGTGWQPKPPQPMERSLGEAAMVSLGINPSAPIPRSNYMEVNEELEKLKDERQALEGIRKRMDMQEKKLVLIVTRLDRVEERLDAQIVKLCENLEQFDLKIQAFSALMSHMESAQEHNRRRNR